MHNWKTEFELKYHLIFEINNKKVGTTYQSIIIEAENKKQAREIIRKYFDNNPEKLLDFPDYTTSKIFNSQLIIDSIKKVWEY